VESGLGGGKWFGWWKVVWVVERGGLGEV